MRYIADLHIHSCFSRATSKASQIPGLAAWAAIKGIQVVGTGDFTHPGWLTHLDEHLIDAEPGFFRLRAIDPAAIQSLVPAGIQAGQLALDRIRFVLTAEISSIYKKNGRVRKIHNVLMAPDFVAVRRINHALAAIGNLQSDGRPILGLDARDLLAITLEQGRGSFLVPAHIWTPWFSLFGSKSGFDAIEECFEDLTPEIFALETGLSSDPDMNRCVSALDRFTLISNSDCHSPAKLGREANIFDTGFDFPSLEAALRRPVDQDGNQVFAATIEFYPEEGKYHCDGHRKCHVCLQPEQTRAVDGVCPKCGRPVTVGVLHRVMELADRTTPHYPSGSPAVHSLIPLPEILSELLGVGPATKKVASAYARLINTFTSEFHLLLDVPLDEIRQESPLLAEAVDRVRNNRVYRQPGYDGEFGIIRVFAPDELHRLAGQLSLFGDTIETRKKRGRSTITNLKGNTPSSGKRGAPVKSANPEQQAAIDSEAARILVQAGPGTGKTHTLVQRVLTRLRKGENQPITVITFTNKAAGEVRERLDRSGIPPGQVWVGTLHGYCLRQLRLLDPRLRVVGPEERKYRLRQLVLAENSGPVTLAEQGIEDFLRGRDIDPWQRSMARRYLDGLDRDHRVDLAAIIPSLVSRLDSDSRFRHRVAAETGSLYVDEFQDLNVSQYRLIRLLADQCPVFVIGDPDQAIYGFRGADPGWFFRFRDELAAEVHVLRTNYRSDQAIVKAATAVLGHDHEQTLRPLSTDRGRIILYTATDPGDEARWIGERIEELVGGTSHRAIDRIRGQARGLGLADIGILYRTSRQGQRVAQTLDRLGLPFRMVDLEPFYCRGRLRELYLWSLLVSGRADCGHLLELLATTRGIGPRTLDRCAVLLGGHITDPLQTLNQASLPEAGIRAVKTMIKLREQAVAMDRDQGMLPALGQLAASIGFAGDDQGLKRMLDLAGSVAGALEEWGRYLEENSTTIPFEQAEAITLMTVHAAKGTEFSAVFLAGVEDDMLPLRPRGELDQDQLTRHLEEERRLFYVALTRARHHLFISWCRSRRIHGHKGCGRISRFMAAIPGDLITPYRETGRARRRQRQLSLFPDP